jgi:hypothetical protein
MGVLRDRKDAVDLTEGCNRTAFNAVKEAVTDTVRDCTTSQGFKG